MNGNAPNTPAARLLHTMLRVHDLPAMLAFYCGGLGMRELRRLEIPEQRRTLVFIGYGGSEHEAQLELWWDWDSGPVAPGSGSYGHVGIGVDDIHSLCAAMQQRGYRIARAPGPVRTGGRLIALLHDPQGNEVELLAGR